jgi:hypothetical protein
MSSDSEEDLEINTPSDNLKKGFSLSGVNDIGRGLQDIKEKDNEYLGEEVKIIIQSSEKEKEYMFRKGHGIDLIMKEVEKDFNVPISKQELFFNSKLIPNFLTLSDIKDIQSENTFNLKIK